MITMNNAGFNLIIKMIQILELHGGVMDFLRVDGLYNVGSF